MTEPTDNDNEDDAQPDERPLIRVGDHVTDRETDDAKRALVVARPGLSADEYETSKGTVASVNKDYEPSEPVVEVVFIDRTAGKLPGDATRYAYPRGRLERVASLHDDEGEI